MACDILAQASTSILDRFSIMVGHVATGGAPGGLQITFFVLWQEAWPERACIVC